MKTKFFQYAGTPFAMLVCCIGTLAAAPSGAVAAELNTSEQSTGRGSRAGLATKDDDISKADYFKLGGQVLDDFWVERASGTALTGRYRHTAVWTGSEMIIWGGHGLGGYLNDGGRYNPAANSWIPVTTNGAPTGRYGHTAVWTGSEMIVWGGDGESGYLNTGGRYDPVAAHWTPISTNGVPQGCYLHTAVWNGSQMIVWGGWYNDEEQHLHYSNAGGRYDPMADNWVAMSTNDAPTARGSHTAVWTGNQMIAWGGYGVGGYRNDGGRYNPVANTWAAMTINGAPKGRGSHTAVWTGDEMIVWGGDEDVGPVGFNDGGRYNPTTDHWSAVTTDSAPSGRSYHTAVWTGNEMIVWGGTGGGYQNDGGRYDPATDSWTAMTTNGAPAGRWGHTAVWTGSQMIIWGGQGGSTVFNDTFSYFIVASSPALTIAPAGSGQATLSWAPSTAGWVLQQSLSLSPAAWTDCPSGATNPIVVPVATPTMFYRLYKP